MGALIRASIFFSHRFADPIFGADSWTCRRPMDGERVQMDFMLTSSNLQVVHAQVDLGRASFQPSSYLEHLRIQRRNSDNPDSRGFRVLLGCGLGHEYPTTSHLGGIQAKVVKAEYRRILKNTVLGTEVVVVVVLEVVGSGT